MLKIIIFGTLLMLIGYKVKSQDFMEILPNDYKKGIIVHNFNDTLYFIFKSKDYIDILMKTDFERINDRKSMFSLLDELYNSCSEKYTNSYSIKESYFPNNSALLELGIDRKLIIINRNRNVIINYKVLKKSNYYQIIEKKSKSNIYNESFKIIN